MFKFLKRNKNKESTIPAKPAEIEEYVNVAVDLSISFEKEPDAWEYLYEHKHTYNLTKGVSYIYMKKHISDGSNVFVALPLWNEDEKILIFIENPNKDMPSRAINDVASKHLVIKSYGVWRDAQISNAIVSK